MNAVPVRLEKPLLLISALGICVSLLAALGGNLLIAASTFGITFVLLGQMLDYAVAAQSGQTHWLSGRIAGSATVKLDGRVARRS